LLPINAEVIEQENLARGRGAHTRDPTNKFEVSFRPSDWKHHPEMLPPDVVKLSNLASPESSTLLKHESHIVCTAFSPSGAILAVGCDGGEVNIWDVSRGELIAVLQGHGGKVYDLEFNSDSKRLATGSNDGQLRLWDTASWDLVFKGQEHTSYIHGIAFSPDGSQIATASGDWTLRVWDAQPKPERLAQATAEAEHRRRMQPYVQALFDTGGDARTIAASIRADTSLDADSRRAALRMLLESNVVSITEHHKAGKLAMPCPRQAGHVGVNHS
jgi:WD40 repeat protein